MKITRLSFVLIAGLAAAAITAPALAQPVPATALQSFVGHSSHCQYFVGAAGFRGEDLSGAYSKDVVAVVNELVGKSGDAVGAFETMTRACTMRLDAKAAPIKVSK